VLGYLFALFDLNCQYQKTVGSAKLVTDHKVTVKPRLHDTTGCQTGCQTGLTTGWTTCWTNSTVRSTGCQNGCTTRFDNRFDNRVERTAVHSSGCQTGWMFVYTIQPVVKQNTAQHMFFFCYFYIWVSEQILTRRASQFVHNAPSRPSASQRLPVRPSQTTGHARCITWPLTLLA